MEPQWTRESIMSRRKVFKESKRRMTPHYHDEYELYYLLEGQTQYLIDEEVYRVEEGDFVFIPKGSIHGTDYGAGKVSERILVCFTDDYFDANSAYLREKLMKLRLIHIPKEYLPELEELLVKIEREYHRQEQGREHLLRLYTQELLILICRYHYERKENIRESDALICEVAEYIRQHYGENISLPELSRHFALSDAHLSRRFKAVMGLGINQFTTVVRISKSLPLLERSRFSITEVARQCGFNDSNYFTAVFKKLKGVTPQKYRTQSTKSNR